MWVIKRVMIAAALSDPRSEDIGGSTDDTGALDMAYEAMQLDDTVSVILVRVQSE